ncbi:hypothetical protein ACLOJK_010374 [Asimina triloba]
MAGSKEDGKPLIGDGFWDCMLPFLGRGVAGFCGWDLLDSRSRIITFEWATLSLCAGRTMPGFREETLYRWKRGCRISACISLDSKSEGTYVPILLLVDEEQVIVDTGF